MASAKHGYVILGFLFGLVLPAIGVFVGLQVNSTLGSILAFPLIIGVMISSTPFGLWSREVVILSYLLSGAFWSLIFYLFFRFKNRKV